VIGRSLRQLRDSFLYHFIRFFRIRADSEKVARGFALGLIVNFVPTFGFGVVISGFLARLFRGNVVAGFVGGALLTFFWPVLFVLNVKTGSFLMNSRPPVEDVSELTEKTMTAFMWGRSFTLGTVVNCVVFGLMAYFIVLIAYHRVRPGMLAFFRHHARRWRRGERRAMRIAKHKAAAAPAPELAERR
jgi:uncharacterized protein